MFDQVDQDGDGELDEHEFIRSLPFNPSLLFHSLYIFFLSSPYSYSPTCLFLYIKITGIVTRHVDFGDAPRGSLTRRVEIWKN